MAIYARIYTPESDRNPHHIVELGLTPGAMRKLGKQALLGRQAACLAEYASCPDHEWALQVLMCAHQLGSQLKDRYGIEGNVTYPLSFVETFKLMMK